MPTRIEHSTPRQDGYRMPAEFEKQDGFTNYEIKRNGNCAIYLK